MEDHGRRTDLGGTKKVNGTSNNNTYHNLNQQYRNNLLSAIEVKFSETPCEQIEDDDDNYGYEAKEKLFNGNDRNHLSVKRALSVSETDSCSILSSSTAVTNVKKKDIDGGYGWVVVFASFVISMIVDGISFSFGLIYTELLVYFNESKSKTAWIGALFLAVPLMSGPILSNLVDKYGCRRMTFIGGLLAGSGFALASLSNSIEMLYVTFGFIAGIGIGIGYVTAVVSVAFWFEKKRTFATGLGASGTGLGTFVYAPFTQWMLELFGWRGTTLILAGTLFNVCVCGCLMRDPEWLIEENRLESRSQSALTLSNSSVCLDDIKKMLETGAPAEDVLETLVTNVNTEANQQIENPENNVACKKYRSETHLPTYLLTPDLNVDVRHGSRRSLRRKDQDLISKEDMFSSLLSYDPKSPPMTIPTDNVNSKYLASFETLNPSEKISLDDQESIQSFDGYFSQHMTLPMGSRLSLDESMMNSVAGERADLHFSVRGNSLGTLLEHGKSNKDISIVVPMLDTKRNARTNLKPSHRPRRSRKINTGEIVGNLRRNLPTRSSNYFRNMRIHRNSINYRGAMMNTHRYRLRASSCPNIYRNSMTTLAQTEDETWYDNFVDIMKSVFDFSLFLDPKFFCFNLSTLFLFIWFIVPYFCITDHLLKFNYTEQDGANLISVIGIFNTIGMIGLGYIGDQPWLHVSKTYSVCLVFCGISTALMPLCVENYTMLQFLAAIFGLTFASSFSFTPIILVRLVDLDEFTCAYGLVLLVQGVGNLVGPPLSGLIYEYTLRWDGAFYAAGFFIAISGILAWVTGYLEDRDEEKQQSQNQSNLDSCSIGNDRKHNQSP